MLAFTYICTSDYCIFCSGTFSGGSVGLIEIIFFTALLYKKTVVHHYHFLTYMQCQNQEKWLLDFESPGCWREGQHLCVSGIAFNLILSNGIYCLQRSTAVFSHGPQGNSVRSAVPHWAVCYAHNMPMVSTHHHTPFKVIECAGELSMAFLTWNTAWILNIVGY